MNENTTEFTHSTRAVFGLADARVEEHDITPRKINGDRTKMAVKMRLGGDYGKYYLTACVVFLPGGVESHKVSIRPRGGNEDIERLSMEMEGAAPDEMFGLTQSLCETYINAASDWYAKAVAAEESGDDDV
jgi:hypothetical protein